MSNQSVNVRQAFQARPGYYFMDFDYGQIEFRLSAALAGEKPLVIGFDEGNDYYTMIYDSMNGTSYKTKDKISASNRKIGKEISLGQNYGQEAGGLARKLKVDREEGQRLMDLYWNGLPATRLAREKALQFAMQTGGVRTWFGRIRLLPDLFSNDRRVKAKAVRSVWNTIIQGTAADWIKIAMVRLDAALAGRDAHMLLTVHDELLVEVSEKEPFWEIRKILLEAMEFKVKGLPVGMTDRYPDGYFIPVGESYGYDWGNLYDKPEEFLAKFGANINTSPVRPDLAYSFIATHRPQAPTIIPERQRNVAGKEPKKTQMELLGMHPIDELLNMIRAAKGQAPLVEVPIPQAAPPTQPPITVDPQITVSTTDVDSGMLARVQAVATAMPPPPPQMVPAMIPPAATSTMPVFASAGGTNGQVIAEPPKPKAPERDFTYPCLILHVTSVITEKEVNFLKALLSKFKGEHWFYVDYQEKMAKMGADFRCDPNPDFQGFLRRCFGNGVQFEVYDAAGKPARGRVNFS